jgi:hypothetical protein
MLKLGHRDTIVWGRRPQSLIQLKPDLCVFCVYEFTMGSSDAIVCERPQSLFKPRYAVYLANSYEQRCVFM